MYHASILPTVTMKLLYHFRFIFLQIQETKTHWDQPLFRWILSTTSPLLNTLPGFQTVARASGWQGSTPPINGQLMLSHFNQCHSDPYSSGASFNADASLPAQVIPPNAVIASSLADSGTDQLYTVRVDNDSGYYIDRTAILTPTGCDSPAEACLPQVIQQTRRSQRLRI
jgi:hypothetical protein